MTIFEVPEAEYYLSAGAAIAIVIALIFDLGIWRKSSPVFSFKHAVTWTVIWIVLALVYNVLIYLFMGQAAALQFLSGYLVEKALSVDNLFIFLLIFSYFKVPKEYQPKVLFWGFAGAIVFRILMITGGLFLIEHFLWLNVVLGAFLIFTGVKTMLSKGDDNISLEDKWALKLCRKFLPVSPDYDGNRFFTRVNSKFMFTPLFVVVVLLETTDVMFAIDSVPAILGISHDPLILITSNAFAILGLRALFFILDSMFTTFRYLKHGVSLILIYVGAEMALHHYYDPSELVTLAVIGSILTTSVVLSVFIKQDVESNRL
jgi:tellurite resistance protein TerC